MIIRKSRTLVNVVVLSSALLCTTSAALAQTPTPSTGGEDGEISVPMQEIFPPLEETATREKQAVPTGTTAYP